MGNGFIDWFGRSYKGIIIVLLAIMAATLVVLATQHVSASRAAVGATAHPAPTFGSSDERPIVAFLGDSYTAGSGEDSGADHRFPTLVGQHLDVRPVVLADGGAGYTHAGLSGQPFAAQVARVPETSKVVVIYGSRNDPFDGSSTDAVRAASGELFAAVKERAKDAKVIVVGPSFVESPVPSGARANSAAIQASAEAAGVQFVDATNWFQGTPPEDIGSDGVHPTDKGHEYLTSKIEPLVKDGLG
jgi:lysophospholipase L1-like esterase